MSDRQRLTIWKKVAYQRAPRASPSASCIKSGTGSFSAFMVPSIASPPGLRQISRKKSRKFTWLNSTDFLAAADVSSSLTCSFF